MATGISGIMIKNKLKQMIIRLVVKMQWHAVLAATALAILIFSCNGHDEKANERTRPAIGKTTDIKPMVIEVTGVTGAALNPASLFNIYKEKYAAPPAVYQWKNHLVIYGNLNDPDSLLKQIESRYPGSAVKVYKDPFYEFNRRRCGDSGIVKDRDNILLTANLVNDPKLQQEYLDYHATQFEKWPEVSKGFCNAEFQQLLVFRNGRQLMLIISIPAHKSLDSLNPKTTENNPRVDEWNKIMKKYQEGIEGSAPGEVWVFLKPIGAGN